METKKIYFFLSIIIIFLIFFLAAISQQNFLLTINSDYLYPFETASNFINNKTLAGQNLPAAPYFFPDLLLILLLNIGTHNIALIHYFYSLMFLTTYVIVVFRLMYICVPHYYLAIAGTLVALTECFIIVVPEFNFLREWPGSHLSILLFSLGFIGFYIQTRQKHFSYFYYLLLFFLTYLIFISDKLLFAQFIFPFILILILDLIKKRVGLKRGCVLLCLMILVVLAGAKIDFILEKYFAVTYSNNGSLFRIRKFINMGHTLPEVWHFFTISVKENKLAYIVLLTNSLITLGFLWRMQKKNLTVAPIYTIVLFLCIAPLSNLILAVLAGKLTKLAYLRYLGTLYFFPPIGAAAVMVYLWQNPAGRLIKITLSIVTSSVIIGLWSDLPLVVSLRKFNLSPPYTYSIQCLDRLRKFYPIQNGLAEYWSVRPARMLSKNRVQVTQIDKNLKLTNMIDNLSFFSSRSYQFIIINNLSREKIYNAVGKPDKIVFCPHQEIWLYVKKESNVRMNKYFSSHLAWA